MCEAEPESRPQMRRISFDRRRESYSVSAERRTAAIKSIESSSTASSPGDEE